MRSGAGLVVPHRGAGVRGPARHGVEVAACRARRDGRLSEGPRGAVPRLGQREAVARAVPVVAHRDAGTGGRAGHAAQDALRRARGSGDLPQGPHGAVPPLRQWLGPPGGSHGHAGAGGGARHAAEAGVAGGGRIGRRLDRPGRAVHASARVWLLLKPPEYPTAVQERADLQDTLARLVDVLCAGLGVRWIDHEPPCHTSARVR